MFNFPKKSNLWILAVTLIIIGIALFWFWPKPETNYTVNSRTTTTSTQGATTSEGFLPTQKILVNDYHVFQTFNNCAPAAFSMALSYFGINKDQEELADILRPYHNLTGKNDDKSTPPEELAAQAETYGLVAYFRPNGDIETLKKILNLGLPITVRTLLYPNKDYAHYRVIKGYDDLEQEIIQDDSLEGKDLRFSYEEFLTLWKPFNYAYLVIAPTEKKAEIEKILGENLSWPVAWQKAADRAQIELGQDPDNLETNFNLSVAYYYLGKFSDSTFILEKIKDRLPEHTLWYQVEPIKAYFEINNFEKVFSLTDKIFQDGNKAASELYLLRGQSLLKQNKPTEARAEFEKAFFYNENSIEAQKSLEALPKID